MALSQLDKTSKSSKKFETCGNPFVRIRWSNCITVVVVRYGFIFAKGKVNSLFSIQFWSWVGGSNKCSWRWWRSTTCWNSVSLRCARLKLSSHWPLPSDYRVSYNYVEFRTRIGGVFLLLFRYLLGSMSCLIIWILT